MNGLNAWYHVDGIVKPKIVGQCVFWSAHSCMVLPCCSYTAQNAATITHATTMAMTRGLLVARAGARSSRSRTAPPATASESGIHVGSVSRNSSARMPIGTPTR